MPWLGTVTVVGLVVLAALVVLFFRQHRKDLIAAMLEKRRATSKLVTRADYVEGTEEIPVALALTESTFYYENPDLEASFDLDRIDEIEYADSLATGHEISDACRVLRLRSHGATFEFLLGKDECAKWMAALPARSYGNITAPAATATPVAV